MLRYRYVMSSTCGGETPTAVIKVDAQHRVVLPRAIRESAIVGAGDELIAFADGRGRIVLATKDAVKSELRSMFAAGRRDWPPDEDSTARVRRMRDQDALAEAERESQRVTDDRSLRGHAE